MKHKIISIGRQFGSGGHEIGAEIAASLGIGYYDKELIAMAAKRGELFYDRLARFDERQENPWLYEGIYEGNSNVPRGQSVSAVLFKLQSDVIRMIAKKKNAVIMGRCSDFILRDMEDVSLLTVFISAPFDMRVARKMELEKLSWKKAESLVKKTDKQRSQYYKSYTGIEWGQAEHFDLYFDCGVQSKYDIIETVIRAYYDLPE